MTYPENLYSVNLERTCLGGLINNTKTLIELDSVLTDKDFFFREHMIIFSILRGLVLGGRDVDKVLLAQKCKELNLNSFNELDIFSYIDSASFTKINEKGVIEFAKELIKLRIKREIFLNAQEIQSFISEKQEKTIEQLISGADKIYNDKINQYISTDIPSDLFAEAEDIIKERALNTDKIVNINTPFKIFNDMFGSLRVGLTAICGRAKNNKSSILLNIGFGAALQDKDLHILYLDTELKKQDHAFRCMAAFSQINMAYIEDGSWLKNKELADKINNSWGVINSLKGKFHHHYIGNRPIEEVIGIIKRWYYSVCKRGGKALVILDYIKIGDEKLSNFNGEHQELGRKINSLNAVSQELGIPILSSMQLNRSAITDQKEDESAISMTDRLSWFANGVFIFRKKRPDEVADEGEKFGTHKLIPVVLRYQGKNTSLLDLVRVTDHHSKNNKPSYRQNFINFNFSNFLLEERGTLRDIVKDKSLSNGLQNNEIEDANKF